MKTNPTTTQTTKKENHYYFLYGKEICDLYYKYGIEAVRYEMENGNMEHNFFDFTVYPDYLVNDENYTELNESEFKRIC
jgi:hypothetical protein